MKVVSLIDGASYVTADLSAIDCEVVFAEIGEPVPFTARPDDPEEHGREIWRRLQAGEAGEIAPFAEPAIDMPALRAAALATAIEYGNRLTQPELAQWAGVEPLSWTQQRSEALIVKAGETLSEFAVLPGLAEDKGITLDAYADDVLANAGRYQVVLRAAIAIRRRATNVLTNEALDTPEKLAEAVTALTTEANALAGQLLGSEP